MTILSNILNRFYTVLIKIPAFAAWIMLVLGIFLILSSYVTSMQTKWEEPSTSRMMQIIRRSVLGTALSCSGIYRLFTPPAFVMLIIIFIGTQPAMGRIIPEISYSVKGMVRHIKNHRIDRLNTIPYHLDPGSETYTLDLSKTAEKIIKAQHSRPWNRRYSDYKQVMMFLLATAAEAPERTDENDTLIQTLFNISQAIDLTVQELDRLTKTYHTPFGKELLNILDLYFSSIHSSSYTKRTASHTQTWEMLKSHLGLDDKFIAADIYSIIRNIRTEFAVYSASDIAHLNKNKVWYEHTSYCSYICASAPEQWKKRFLQAVHEEIDRIQSPPTRDQEPPDEVKKQEEEQNDICEKTDRCIVEDKGSYVTFSPM